MFATQAGKQGMNELILRQQIWDTGQGRHPGRLAGHGDPTFGVCLLGVLCGDRGVYATASTQRSENSVQESVLAFHNVGPRDQT